MTGGPNPLLSPIRLGDIDCQNRVVMAPMTRSRAGDGDCPTELHVEYYSQRASAGLIVTEGVQPSIDGKGYARTPGLHEPAQVRAWSRVTDAVHARGGRIVAQLMHAGRVGSHYNKRPGARTVAPSAVRADVSLWTDAAGMQPCDEPEALSLADIAAVIEDYAQAARLAREAGFDGVELHCTSGYLPMQFLASNTNRRSDGYGGSAQGRARFVVEVLEALVAAIGAGRVGFRICPGNPFNGVVDENPLETYQTLLGATRPLGCAHRHGLAAPGADLAAFARARAHPPGRLIIHDGFDPQSAAAAVQAGRGDAVSFGRHYIANPDLVERIASGAPLASFNRKTLYTPGAAGYTDYPAWVPA
ncbi:MAG: alkene reductase [Steroidobacteraceae bacterium]